MLNLHTLEAYVDIHTLRYFLTVCQEGTMSRAAEVLHITQPTLSRQSPNLERELDRSCSSATAGTSNPPKRESTSCDAPSKSSTWPTRREPISQRTARSVEGDISIAAGETHGMKFIAHAVSTFQAEYPQVRFHIHSADASVATHRLDNGIADFAVLLGYPNVSDYRLHSPACHRCLGRLHAC